MDRGIKYFHLIKQYLVKVLKFKEHEVGIIRSGMPKNGKNSKEYIKNLFNGEVYNENSKTFEKVSDDERIKIIIGSATIKEGINLQKYGTVLYDCFLDWNPTDFQQLVGRIWRQGNTFGSIRVVCPLVIDSVDIFLFQKLQEKTSRLNTIWATDGKSNVMDTEELNPEELKYALIRDPKVIAELKAVEEKSKLEGEVIAQRRLVDIAKETIKTINTIRYRFDSVLKAYKEYRDFDETNNKLLDAERLVKGIVALEKSQTDREGKKMIKAHRWDNITPELLKEHKLKPEQVSDKAKFDKYEDIWNYSEFAWATREFQTQLRDFLQPYKLHVSQDDTSRLDKFIEEIDKRISELKERQEEIMSDKNKKRLEEEVLEERLRLKIQYKTLSQSVADFARLNFLLNDKVVDIPVVEERTCPPMKDGVRLIDDESIRFLEDCVAKQPQTKDKYFDKETGRYTDVRHSLHEQILHKIFNSVKCQNREQPIAVFTGGAPASGKSYFLKNYAPWMLSNEVFTLDADAIRAMLPEYNGWNASATHMETKDITDYILKHIGDQSCKYDFVYDGTMNKAEKYFGLINKVKAMGYKTFIIFMTIPYGEAKARALDRYQRKGRYVPSEIIDEFFTMLPDPINKTKGQYALDQLKPLVDGYMVVDGLTGKILEKHGEDLPTQRYFGKKTVKIEPVGDVTDNLSKEPVQKITVNEEPVKKAEEIKHDSKKLKYKTGDVITCRSGAKFYLNAVPADIKEKIKTDYDKSKQDVSIFFKKNIYETPTDIIGQIRNWYDNLKQPTEKQVRNAMLLIIDEDYALKAGGESSSDHQYSSSLKWIQSSPTTGEDVEPVIVKRHSSKFENVLIKLEDLEDLFDATYSDTELEEKRIDDLKGVIGMWRRCKTHNLIGTSDGDKPCTDEEQAWIIRNIKELDRGEAVPFIDYLMGRFRDEALHGEDSSRNDKYIAAYEELKQLIGSVQHKETESTSSAPATDSKQNLMDVIEGLTLAMKYLTGKEKKEAKQQVDDLKLSLKYI
jgi:predicted kinase